MVAQGHRGDGTGGERVIDDWFKNLTWPQVILIGLVIVVIFVPWQAWV